MKESITYEDVKTFFSYDPVSGIMKRILKPDRWGNVWPYDKELTTPNDQGYYTANFRGVVYKIHRLAFLYMLGDFPENDVDHINGIRTDNRWVNLRAVDRKGNTHNIGIARNNKSGYPGVDFHNVVGKFQARIRINGERVRLGFFDTKEEAIKEKQKYEKLLGFHPNHGKRLSWARNQLEEQS